MATILKPYYKYKQDAYSKLNGLFKGILRDCGFYSQYPELESEGLVFSYTSKEDLKSMPRSSALFGYDPGMGVDCQIVVSVRNKALLEFKEKGIFYRIPNGTRLTLTDKEAGLVRKCLTELYRSGSDDLDTAPSSFVYRLQSWYFSPDVLKFCSIRGETYRYVKR